MPVSRKRSCLACQVSKVRCSLARPRCERCQVRNLDCRYDADGSRDRPRRRLERLVPKPASASASSTLGAATLSAGNTDSTLIAPGDTPLSDLDNCQLHLATQVEALDLQCEPMPWPTASDLALLNAPSSDPILEWPSWLQLDDPPPTLSPSGHLSMDSVLSDQLATIPPALALRGTLTTKMLIGQVLSYPRRMLTNRLPPFISPPCRHGVPCPPTELHSCIPRPLAACQAMVAMFSAVTPGNAEFVKSAVCQEADRLRRECDSYDGFDLLAASQACIIYMLCYLERFARSELQSAAVLLNAVTVTSLKIARTYGRHDGGAWIERVDPREWFLIESMKRSACLMFGLELLFAIFRRSDACAGFRHVHLPCSRELWDPVSDAEWFTRQAREITRRGGRRHLAVGDLASSNQPSSEDAGTVAQYGAADCMADLSHWCANVDEMGMLVWMASTLS